MSSLTRRDLLRSGVVVSASSLAGGSFVSRANALLAAYPGPASAEALSAIAPREHLLLDFGWKFQFGPWQRSRARSGLGQRPGRFRQDGRVQILY